MHVSSPIHAFAYGVKVLNILIGSVSNCFLIVFYVKLYSYLLEYDYFFIILKARKNRFNKIFKQIYSLQDPNPLEIS